MCSATAGAATGGKESDDPATRVETHPDRSSLRYRQHEGTQAATPQNVEVADLDILEVVSTRRDSLQNQAFTLVTVRVQVKSQFLTTIRCCPIAIFRESGC